MKRLVSQMRQFIQSAAVVLVVLIGLAGAFWIGTAYQSSRPVNSLGVIPVWGTASSSDLGCTLATGSYGNSSEALYYLDSQSGRLSAALLARETPDFAKLFTRSIKTDLAGAVAQFNLPMPTSPRFIMVTGESDIRQFGAGDMNKITKAVAYVAEITTGIVMVYALPNEGDRDMETVEGEIILWTMARLNNGLGTVPAGSIGNSPAPISVPPATNPIQSTGYRWGENRSK